VRPSPPSNEANGWASVFLGAVAAGLIAPGFEGFGRRRSAGTVVFEVILSTAEGQRRRIQAMTK